MHWLQPELQQCVGCRRDLTVPGCGLVQLRAVAYALPAGRE